MFSLYTLALEVASPGPCINLCLRYAVCVVSERDEVPARGQKPGEAQQHDAGTRQPSVLVRLLQRSGVRLGMGLHYRYTAHID